MNNKFLNSPLRSQIQRTTHQGRKVPALVIESFYNKITVRLATTGAILRNLDIIGGPVEAGQVVKVDYSSDVPVALAEGVEGLNEDDVIKLLEDLLEDGVEAALQMSITIFSGGSLREIYTPDANGLATAIGEANEGDVIYLPDIDITTDITVPDEVSIVGISSRQSIIRGTVTLNPSTDKSCSLENVCVLNGVYSDSEISGVIVKGNGIATIKDCEIHCYNCFSGRANGVTVEESTVTAIFKGCTVVADSDSGTAYGFKGIASGNCTIASSFVYGKTAEYDGAGLYVNGNTQAISEIDRGCPTSIPDDSENYRAVHTSGNALHGIVNQYFPIVGDLVTPDTPYNFHSHTNTHFSGTIIRNGNYLYVQNRSPSSNYYVREYDITDWTSTDLLVMYDSAPGGLLFMSCIGDRKLIVTQPDTTQDDFGSIYEVDFATSTSTKVHEVNFSNHITIPGNDGLNVDSPASNISFINPDGDVICIIAGTYDEYKAFEATYYGFYTWSKNITQDTGWEENFKLFSTTNYDTDQPWLYSQPAVVRNEKVVYGISGGFNGSSFDNTNRYDYVGVFDVYTHELTYLTNTVLNATFNDMTVYYAVPNNNDGVAFIFAEFGNDTNYISVWMVDPYTMELTTSYWTDAEPSNQIGFASRTKAYAYFGNPGAMHLLTRDGHSQLWSGWAQPLSFWNNHDNLVDDNGRIWYFDKTDPTKYIKGLLVTDKTDIDSYAVTGITGYNYTNVIVAGDFLIIIDHDVSGSNCYFYTIEETPAS